MNRRGSILFVHPAGTGICSPFINDYRFRAAVGTSLEDATFVLHMIAKQILHRYPNIKFIAPHLGGPIPMLLNRLDKQSQLEHPKPGRAASVTAKKLWAAFTCVLEAFGADHLVNRQRLSGAAELRGLQRDFRLGLPKADTDRILHHNAQAPFGFRH